MAYFSEHPNRTVEREIEAKIKRTELFSAMKSCGRYGEDHEIVTAILDMRSEVRGGQDPEEVLHEEGFEPDYVFDLV